MKDDPNMSKDIWKKRMKQKTYDDRTYSMDRYMKRLNESSPKIENKGRKSLDTLPNMSNLAESVSKNEREKTGKKSQIYGDENIGKISISPSANTIEENIMATEVCKKRMYESSVPDLVHNAIGLSNEKIIENSPMKPKSKKCKTELAERESSHILPGKATEIDRHTDKDDSAAFKVTAVADEVREMAESVASGKWISNDEINHVIDLVKAECPENIRLMRCCYLKYPYLKLERNSNFIQIANTVPPPGGLHWILFSNVLNKPDEVTIYDSLLSEKNGVGSLLHNQEVCKIVKTLYEKIGIRKIIIPVLEHQEDHVSCGLYCIMYMTLLLKAARHGGAKLCWTEYWTVCSSGPIP